MSRIILFIFEGEEPESMIYNSLQKNFFASSKSSIIISYFRAEIYQLWKEVKADKDLDTVAMLEKRDNPNLSNISREQIEEIHLFFDHDAHSHLSTMTPKEYNKLINDMLATFNDEYAQGKLWISYPMAEAIRHCKKDANVCFGNCIADITKNKDYRNLVSTLSDYQDIRKFTPHDWHYFIAISIQKVYCLLNGAYTIPPYQEIKDYDQKIIHEKQVEKFIDSELKVAVLSAFPLFLLY
jgi:hypothetical protein